jgi:hypothetical protein
MKLAPKDPPGRSTRRARGFAADIRHLRAQGYTFEAIRQALDEAGMAVSNSTIQREMARQVSPLPASSVGVAEPTVPAPDSMPALAIDQRSGKEIAEAFAKGRINNPLFRNRPIKKDAL